MGWLIAHTAAAVGFACMAIGYAYDGEAATAAMLALTALAFTAHAADAAGVL
ncbi:hypothetical protein D3C72_1270650 [compost metagenome]